jgi:CheY-like chemotaxis protein
VKGVKKFDLLLYEESAHEAQLFQEALQTIREDCSIHVLQSGHDFADYAVNLAESRKGDNLPNLIIISLDKPVEVYDTRMNFTKTKVLTAIPVVVLIPHTSQEEVDNAYAHGACSVIKKPKTPEELQETIKEICLYWIEFSSLPKRKVSE